MIEDLVHSGEYALGNETEPFIKIEYNIKRLVPLNKLVIKDSAGAPAFVPANSIFLGARKKPSIIRLAQGFEGKLAEEYKAQTMESK